MKKYLVCLFISFSAFAKPAPTIENYDHYKPYARKQARISAHKVEAYLRAVQERRAFDAKDPLQEFEDFLKWILVESGLTVNPVADLPRLQKAFLEWLKMCDLEKKVFKEDTSIIVSISTKYLSYGACLYAIPAPVNVVVPGLVCAPIGQVVGKQVGYFVGDLMYKGSCE